MVFIPPGEKVLETRVCRLSKKEFVITDKDLEFYSKYPPQDGVALDGALEGPTPEWYALS